jgi:hypothetical protein
MEKLGGLTEKLKQNVSCCFQRKKINNENKADVLQEEGSWIVP